MMQMYPYQMTAQLRVSGEDAADFLHSQFSNDLRPFQPGLASYGLGLDVKGKVVADSWVWCAGPEEFRIFSEYCLPEIIAEKLERHIIADDVEIEVLAQPAAVAFIGAGEGFAALPLPDGALARLPGRRAVQPAWEYVFADVAGRDAFVARHAAARIAEKERQQLRLQAGVAMVPAEIGPGELPGEGGLDVDAVAFSKGCFLGQEVVARMRNLGKATRQLYLLRGEGSPPRCPATLCNADGKAAGEVRTAFPDGDGWFGVALLKLRYAAAGLQLEAGAGIRLESKLQRQAQEVPGDG